MTGRDRPKRLDSPLFPRVAKAASRAQTWIYRRTGGRIGGTWRLGSAMRKPIPLLLLKHTGRKSGRTFTTPVAYLQHGEDVVVVASQGGLANDPQWYRNLREHPRTRIQIGSKTTAVIARTAEGAERSDLWVLLVDMFADFDAYQSWTDRRIPVVVLEPDPAATRE